MRQFAHVLPCSQRINQVDPPADAQKVPRLEAADLDQIRHSRELNALRIVALARLGVAAVMIIATHVGLKPKWPQFSWVPYAYGVIAVVAVVLLFSTRSHYLVASRMQLVLVIIDVAAIFTYKIISADGAYVPLLVLMLLPIMVVLDVSWRRATVALAVIAGTFAVEIYTDPVMRDQIGFARMTLATVIFVFLCCTVWLAVYAQGRQLDEIARLSASRQALLVDIMTASDEQQRVISEFIHDGPLQSVLMARQDIMSVLKRNPDEALERALAGLRGATDQMRQATFELHPAVLAGAGLARAVTQLADANSERSGIDITTDIDYPNPDLTDPIVFAVARELLSNIVRHSRATRATVTLKATDGVCHLDVVDDGIGIAADAAVNRLRKGHIGLASQRARIEAAGGTLQILEVPNGTHVAVTVPLARAA